MANPKGNPQNLIPNSERTPEELKAQTSKAGVASGEVRREKKRMFELYSAILAKKYKVKDDEGKDIELKGSDMIELVIGKVLQRGDSATVAMIKELREGIDGNVVDLEVLDVTGGLTHDQKRKRAAELLARRTPGQSE